ncbi:DEAD/DEAH box helicase [Candidatus Pacearchaeota archaeon]|nr:DEAD/DEAH box helicase [Candidatus Pacearchaeota archaeon]
MEKFTKLGLSKELTDVLKHAGFTEPSEIQKKAIPVALAGKDIIGGSATGSGKTLAFASPILENLEPSRKIQAMILTPTRELAEQVAQAIRDFAKNKKLNVLAVYGGVRIESQIKKLYSTDVLVGTPGRIQDHINRRTLRLDGLKILVLDEVDRMFDMGFSRDVEKIIHECPEERQTMMFSATISSEIDYLAQKYTKNPVEIAVKSHIDPSKLKQVYYDVPDNKKFSLLVSLLKKEDADLVMVFCSTRRNVDFISDNLIGAGIHARAIHGGLEQKKRIRVLDEFHKKGVGVLVCTDVAARGLDIKGVTHVYNYDVPADHKDYIHRIGRTARAGEKGKAITILASRDYEKFSDISNIDAINITPEKLPQLEIVRIRIAQGRNDTRARSNGPRIPGGRNFGRGNPRRDSRGPRSSGPSRGPRSSGGRSFGGSSGGRSFGGKSFSRDGPKKYNSSGSNRDRPRNSGGRSFGGSSSGGSFGGSSGGRSFGGKSFSRDGPKKYGDNNSDRDGPKKYDRKPKPNRISPSKYGRKTSGPKRYSKSGPSKGGKSSYGKKPGIRRPPSKGKTNIRRPKR